MFGPAWFLLLLLSATAATARKTSTTGQHEEKDLSAGLHQDPYIEADLTPPPAESLQVSVVVDAEDDLHTAATGYGGGRSHRDHKAGYHDAAGYKGNKGHKAQKGYKKTQYGDHAKAHNMGYHDNHGKKYKGHDDKAKYYGDAHKGKKGKKGHHYGSKGHHNKGHKDKGYKNVYHKEEYHHTKKFYDDHDDKKYHNGYDDYDSYFKAHKGKDHKGGHYKRNSSNSNEADTSDFRNALEGQPDHHETQEGTGNPSERENSERKTIHQELPNRALHMKTGRVLLSDDKERVDPHLRSKKTGNRHPLREKSEKIKSKTNPAQDGKRLDKHLEKPDKEPDGRKASKEKSKRKRDNETHQKENRRNTQKNRSTTRTRNRTDKPVRKNHKNMNVSKDKNHRKHTEKIKKANIQDNKIQTKTKNRREKLEHKFNKNMNIDKDKKVKHSDDGTGNETVKKRYSRGNKSDTKVPRRKASGSQSDERLKPSGKKSRKGQISQTNVKAKKKKNFKRSSKVSERKDVPRAPKGSKNAGAEKHREATNEPDPSGSSEQSRLERHKEKSQDTLRISETWQPPENPAVDVFRLDRRICKLKYRICLAAGEQKLLRDASRFIKRQSRGRDAAETNKMEALDDKARVTRRQAGRRRQRLHDRSSLLPARVNKVREFPRGRRHASKQHPGEGAAAIEARRREKKSLKSYRTKERNSKMASTRNRQQLMKNSARKDRKLEPKKPEMKAERKGKRNKEEKPRRKSPKTRSNKDRDTTTNVSKSLPKKTQQKKQRAKERRTPEVRRPQGATRSTKQERTSKMSPAGRVERREKKNVLRNGPSRESKTEEDKDHKPKPGKHQEKHPVVKKKTKAESTSSPRGHQSTSTRPHPAHGSVDQTGSRAAGQSRTTVAQGGAEAK